MTKQFTTSEIITMYSALKKFEDRELELPVQLAWDIEDNIETLKRVVVKFERVQNEILKPLREKNAFIPSEEAGMVKIKPEFNEEFLEANEKISRFLETTNDIDVVMSAKDNLPDVITLNDLRAIKFMIA